MRWWIVIVVACGLAAATAWAYRAVSEERPRSVAALTETEGVVSEGDSADDPAIWIDDADPARSLVLATDKEAGLLVHDLHGKRLQFLPHPGLNNVDVRPNVELGGREVGLVAASDDERHRVAFFTIDPATREVAELPGGGLDTGVEGEGLCLYRSGKDGAVYVFVVGERHGTEDHAAEQWRLEATPDGALAGTLVRTIPLGPRAEGCAADDLLGFLYVAVERRGVVRYGAEPDAGEQGECVVKTGFLSGHEGDLEGIAIAGEGEDGVLVVSNQGESEFLVFRRAPPHAWLGKFEIGKGRHDAVTRTDGIALTAAALGEAFPHGLFVAQDDDDEGSDRQNFKLVSWSEVRAALAKPDARGR